MDHTVSFHNAGNPVTVHTTAHGIFVTGANPNARKAGLSSRDRILQINGFWAGELSEEKLLNELDSVGKIVLLIRPSQAPNIYGPANSSASTVGDAQAKSRTKNAPQRPVAKKPGQQHRGYSDPSLNWNSGSYRDTTRLPTSSSSASTDQGPSSPSSRSEYAGGRKSSEDSYTDTHLLNYSSHTDSWSPSYQRPGTRELFTSMTSTDMEVDPAPGNDVTTPTPVGLRNFGNSCYFNAALQGLCHTHYLEDMLSSRGSRSSAGLTGKFLKLLNDYLQESWSTTTYSRGLDAKDLHDTLVRRAHQFTGTRQQDSHDVLRHLLDGLKSEEQTSQAQITGVDKLFGGHFITTFVCSSDRCQNPHYHLFAPFHHISLSISFGDMQQPERSSGYAYTTGRSSYRRGMSDSGGRLVDLEKCLEFHMRKEDLDAGEYFCPSCSRVGDRVEYRSGTKRTLIFRPPAVLTLHFKRFTQTPSGLYEKISAPVDYPELLDMTGFCSSLHGECSQNQRNKAILYSLYAVVIHSGILGSGHYTACVKVRSSPPDLRKFTSPCDCHEKLSDKSIRERGDQALSSTGKDHARPVPGRWFMVSDQSVHEASTYRHSDAYMLFYERIH